METKYYVNKCHFKGLWQRFKNELKMVGANNMPSMAGMLKVEHHNRTQWVPIVAFGSGAEWLSTAPNNSVLEIEAEFSSRKYKDKNTGQDKTSSNFIMSKVIAIDFPTNQQHEDTFEAPTIPKDKAYKPNPNQIHQGIKDIPQQNPILPKDDTPKQDQAVIPIKDEDLPWD